MLEELDSLIYFIAGPAGQSTCALICLAVGHCEAAVNFLIRRVVVVHDESKKSENWEFC